MALLGEEIPAVYSDKERLVTAMPAEELMAFAPSATKESSVQYFSWYSSEGLKAVVDVDVVLVGSVVKKNVVAAFDHDDNNYKAAGFVPGASEVFQSPFGEIEFARVVQIQIRND